MLSRYWVMAFIPPGLLSYPLYERVGPDRHVYVWRHDRPWRGAVATVGRAACGQPHRPLPAVAGGRAGAVVRRRRLRGPVALVGRRPRRLLAIGVGPLRPAVDHAGGPGTGEPGDARGELVPGGAAQLRRARAAGRAAGPR